MSALRRAWRTLVTASRERDRTEAVRVTAHTIFHTHSVTFDGDCGGDVNITAPGGFASLGPHEVIALRDALTDRIGVPAPPEPGPKVLALVKGLRKAVANEPGWVDANVVRLLLDRYDAAELFDAHGQEEP